MEFKRQSHGGYNYTPRSGNNIGGMPAGFHANFMSPHSHPHPHPHPQHMARGGFRANELHGGRMPSLSLTQSFKNLMKLHADMINERVHCLQSLNQDREYMQSRTITLARDLIKDDFLDLLLREMKAQIEKQFNNSPTNQDMDASPPATDEAAISLSADVEHEPLRNNDFKKLTDGMANFIAKMKLQRQDIENQFIDEFRVYAAREQALMESMFAREGRVEKEFMDFFGDAERQIIEHEKKFRNDNYNQMVVRLRTAERELSYRDQKIMQLEDNGKILHDRCEKLMAELQQVNADHQFEKLQLYHHVEVCKVNAKCLATEELLRWCKWKRCSCGRDYESDLLREFELNFHTSYTSNSQETFPFTRPTCREPKGKDGSGSCTGFQSLPSYQNLITAALPVPVPTGSFIPSEEAATKGIVTNDLRDRYDELQLKAAVLHNYEEVRTMLMKIVCHFKVGGLRVCEEIGGKKFVSTLFYCNSEDLVPAKTGKVFSTGYGDTPEEATERSVKRAFDEIQHMETMNVTDGGMEMTFVRRNPLDSKIGKFDSEPVQMTLLRSYSCEKPRVQSENTQCIQEAYLYHNNSNAEEKYLVDWRIHVRVEDTDCISIAHKLQNILTNVMEHHVYNFIGKPDTDST